MKLRVLAGVTVVLAMIAIALIVARARKANARKESVRTKGDGLGADLYTLENSGNSFNSEAKAHITSAYSYYRGAGNMFDANDLDAANEKYRLGQSNYDAAERMKNEPPSWWLTRASVTFS